jgi:hypothetical protein
MRNKIILMSQYKILQYNNVVTTGYESMVASQDWSEPQSTINQQNSSRRCSWHIIDALSHRSQNIIKPSWESSRYEK